MTNAIFEKSPAQETDGQYKRSRASKYENTPNEEEVPNEDFRDSPNKKFNDSIDRGDHQIQMSIDGRPQELYVTGGSSYR